MTTTTQRKKKEKEKEEEQEEKEEEKEKMRDELSLEVPCCSSPDIVFAGGSLSVLSSSLILSAWSVM